MGPSARGSSCAVPFLKRSASTATIMGDVENATAKGCCNCCSAPLAKAGAVKERVATWAETNCVMMWLGGIGFKSLRHHRRAIFRFSGVAVFCSMILACFSAVALSTNADTLRDFPWSHATGTVINSTSREGRELNETVTGELFVGLTGILREIKTFDKNTQTSHTTDFEGYFAFSKKDKNCESSYCKGCKEAAESCISTVVIALLFSIPTLMSDYTRTHISDDSNLEKVIGMFAGILGGIADLIGLFAFADECVEVLPNHIDRGDSSVHVTWSYGIGVKCLIAATCILMLDGLFHLLVPAPQEILDAEGNVIRKTDDDEELEGADTPLISKEPVPELAPPMTRPDRQKGGCCN